MTGNDEIRTPLRSYTVDVVSNGTSVTSIWAPDWPGCPFSDAVSHACASVRCSAYDRVPSSGTSPPGPHTSTGSRRPAFAMLHTSVGMSPTWSACRCVRNTFVVAVTGRCRPLKFASDPDPRSKKKKSRSGFPTSISTDADPCALLVNGSPLPRIVTRISPSATRSASGSTVGAYSRPAIPPPASASTDSRCPRYASSVISVISVLIWGTFSCLVRTCRQLASALALSALNSSWLIVPASSSAFADAI